MKDATGSAFPEFFLFLFFDFFEEVDLCFLLAMGGCGLRGCETVAGAGFLATGIREPSHKRRRSSVILRSPRMTRMDTNQKLLVSNSVRSPHSCVFVSFVDTVIRPSPGGIVPTRLVICSPRLVIVSKRLVVVPSRLVVVSSRLVVVPSRLVIASSRLVIVSPRLVVESSQLVDASSRL